MPEHTHLPYASLDFAEGRTALYLHEVAAKLGITLKHVSDLVEEGKLDAINLASPGNKTGRRCLRIPIESYRQFVSAALTLSTENQIGRAGAGCPQSTLPSRHSGSRTIFPVSNPSSKKPTPK